MQINKLDTINNNNTNQNNITIDSTTNKNNNNNIDSKNILRNREIKKCSSKYAVPGDIIFLKNSMKMPFDGILLHGTILAN